MTYQEYIAAKAGNFTQDVTLEQHVYGGLQRMREQIIALQKNRAELLGMVKEVEDKLIAAEAGERKYAEQVKAMGLTP